MFDEFYLQKVRSFTRIFLLNGSKLEGDLFLSPTSRYHQRRESVQEFMNSQSPFFILKEVNKVHFINKSHIKYMIIYDEEEKSFVKSESTKESKVNVSFITGDSIECVIPYEPQIYRPRLSDFLCEVDRFFYVYMDKDLLLLRRDSILSINEV